MQVTKQGYYKYLDGYRFIAVALVIVTHWLPAYFDKYPLSKIGVDMFFVLSGFLITEILIRQKKEYTGGEFNLRKVFISFYIRRSLRIFPIYYLIILCFFLLRTPVVIDNLLYFLFYLTNLLIIKNGAWPGMFSHLWSLAIEEQFYIIWPVIILALPLRHISKMILIVLTVSLLYILFSNAPFSSVSILSCMSTLGAGALLAYMKVTGAGIFSNKKYDAGFLSGSLIILFLCSMHIVPGYLTLHFFTLLFSFFLVKMLVTAKSPWLDRTLANPLISFMGRISYGLYLYHNFIPWLLRSIYKNDSANALHSGLVMITLQALLLFVITFISWHLIEKPINRLKRYFTYSSSPGLQIKFAPGYIAEH